MIVLGADAETVAAIYRRAMERRVRLSLYIEEMFETGHDAANRAAVRAVSSADLRLAGLALRANRKAVDAVVKGLPLHE